MRGIQTMRLIGKSILKLTSNFMDTPHKAGYVGSYRRNSAITLT